MSLLDTASLIVTPNGYKEGTLYSVIPSDGSGDMSVVRATTATRVNSAGLIESVANNIPRLDYSNGTCPSLLVEPQRTNLSLYSEQFDNGYWLGNTTKTANNTIAPNGINSADRINATAINFFHRVNGLSSVNSGTAYTFSVYAKANTLGFIQLALNTGFTNDYSISPYANFNLTTGIISQIGNGATAQIESLGNGWYRCSITATSIANALGEVNINLINSGTLSAFQFWSANATDSLFIWGAQLEAGSYPTLYIPTTSASVTRNADVVSKTGINSLIGQTEGTIFLDFVLKNPLSATNRIISITEPSWTDGSIRLDIDYNKFTADFVNGGSTIGNIGYFTTVQPNTRYKVAIAYKVNDCQMYINGVDAGSDTTTALMPTCSELYLNALGGGFNAPYEASNINATALWKTRLTNTQLAQLTTI